MGADNVYRTVQGDAWDSIAYKLWGEERLAHHLLQANPDHADMLIFPAGMVLLVPSHVRRPLRSFSLPPWAAPAEGRDS